MSKFMAVVRTVVLVGLSVYALVASRPAFWSGTATVTVEAMKELSFATLLALGWIAFETLLAWVGVAFRRPRDKASPAPAPPTPGTGAAR